MNDLQRRRQMQLDQINRANQPHRSEFMNGYNLGNKLGGFTFGGFAKRNDGEYDGQDLTKMNGYDKSLSDKVNAQNLGIIGKNSGQLSGFGQNLLDSDYTGSVSQFSNSVDPDGAMRGIAQSADNFVSKQGDGDTNIDAIGAFMNGYMAQENQPTNFIDSSPLTNAVNMNNNNQYQFQVPNFDNTGFNPNKFKRWL